jgi:hypothetical protein
VNATCPNCTPKPSPEESCGASPSDVAPLREERVETDSIRLVDHQIDPGEEQWLTTDEREWSITTGETAARHLLAVARALEAHPIPAPPA